MYQLDIIDLYIIIANDTNRNSQPQKLWFYVLGEPHLTSVGIPTCDDILFHMFVHRPTHIKVAHCKSQSIVLRHYFENLQRRMTYGITRGACSRSISNNNYILQQCSDIKLHFLLTNLNDKIKYVLRFTHTNTI